VQKLIFPLFSTHQAKDFFSEEEGGGGGTIKLFDAWPRALKQDF
jgi:hypothetical protein